ncbi:MAG TPA: discoidin domain-containing protein [Polyangiaceae bacterium]|nr:discoidin domain-containing protein [Polyangiaceae bacterium]
METGETDQQNGLPEGPASPNREEPQESGQQPVDRAASGVEQAAKAAPSADPAKDGARRSGLSRVIDWFWDGPRMRALRDVARREASVVELDRRARLTAEVARRVLDPDDTFVDGRADAIACELNRQACYWALQAVVARQRLAESESAVSAAPPSGEARLESIDPALLERWIPDANERELLRTNLGQDFTAFADLSAEEQARTVRRLSTFLSKLLDDTQTVRHAIDAIWIQRLLRLGLVAAVLVLIGFAGFMVRDRAEAARDLAAGKPWRTSSTYPIAACKPPMQECDESPHFFFHTNEEKDPWIEFDLGSVQRIGSIRIENRGDCCTDRAVPLVVEASTDQKQWRVLARREEKFSNWRALFDPVEARWMRLRVDKKSLLHLKSVRILPP